MADAGEGDEAERHLRVVALVLSQDCADRVGGAVRALGHFPVISRVVVVDGGSADGTTAVARSAGAEVLRLPAGRGWGESVAAGVSACPDADVFVLVSAELGEASGDAAARLVSPLLADEADLALGVHAAAGGREAQRCLAARLAETGMARACGVRMSGALSGQWAVRAGHLTTPEIEQRSGFDLAMTIDLARAGARVEQVVLASPTPTAAIGRGRRSWAGGRQVCGVTRALWSRLTSARLRMGLTIAVTVAVVVGLVWSGTSQVVASQPSGLTADRVVMVGVPHLGLDDLGSDVLPTVSRLATDGLLAATNVRTSSARPSTAEAYASFGAGARVNTDLDVADLAYAPAAQVEGGTAAEVLGRRTGQAADGEVVVPYMPSVVASAGEHAMSDPGTMGALLAEAGLRAGVVTNADGVNVAGAARVRRPAALAVADPLGDVPVGTVDPGRLLAADVAEPYGLRADVDAFVAETTRTLAEAEFVVADLGDTDRAASYAAASNAQARSNARHEALERLDQYVERLVPLLDEDTVLAIVGVTPPTSEWELTPTVVYGPEVAAGALHSLSTKRGGLITLTDLAPTILDWLGVSDSDRMAEMDGLPLQTRAEGPGMGALQKLNDHAVSREAVYFPMTLTFICAQVLFYSLAAVLISQRATRRTRLWLRLGALSCAAWPLATSVERAIPGIEHTGYSRQLIVWPVAVAIAVVASRARRYPLSPLAWIAAATISLQILDVATGARLQLASMLGYSPHTAGRFIGFGNTALAVILACTAVLVAVHVAYAPRRREAVVTAACVLVAVLLADIWPTLGMNVGGMLTMVPVFGLLLLALSGRRLSWRAVALLAPMALVLLAVLIVVHMVQPDEARSHLARYVADGLADGDFWATIERKWATNMRIFSQSMWTWLVPIAAAFMLYVLVIAKGCQRLLPLRSALRSGVVATVAAGVIGWLVNDSGVVVTALSFVYVAPFLTLLALHHRQGRPVLLPPLSPGPAHDSAPRPADLRRSV